MRTHSNAVVATVGSIGVCLALAVACGGGDPPTVLPPIDGADAGVVPATADAAVADGGLADGGFADAGDAADAGSGDGGSVDAGGSDGGPVGCTGTPTACERSAGVCAGKQRSCVDGGFEPLCTAASYGADYSASDVLCDGLDNDCDGHVDVGPPHFLGPTSLPAHSTHWVQEVVATDAGTFLWFRLGLPISPLTLEADGAPRGPASSAYPTVPFGPSSGNLVFAHDGGFRMLANGASTLYAFDFSSDGQPRLTEDGGLRSEVILLDAGLYSYPRAGSALTSSDGRILYALARTNTPGTAMVLRAGDGGLLREVHRPGSDRYGGFATQLADDTYVLHEEVYLSDGGCEIIATRWSSDLVELDGGARTLWVPYDRQGLGWIVDESSSPALVLGNHWYTPEPAHLSVWHPFSDAGLVPWFEVSAAPGSDPPKVRPLALARGHEPLMVAVRRDAPAFDAGTEAMIAIRRDGGTRDLASWHGFHSFKTPSTVIVDHQRALTVFAYPGPQDAGYYSLMFCR